MTPPDDAFPEVDAGTTGEAYRKYIETMLSDDDAVIIETQNRSSKAIGSKEFCRRVDAQHQEATRNAVRPIDIAVRRIECGVPVECVTAEVLRFYRLEERELFRRGNREAKDLWMKLAQTESGLDQREIGMRIGHADGSAVSRRLVLIAAWLADDRRLVQRYQEIRSAIANVKA